MATPVAERALPREYRFAAMGADIERGWERGGQSDTNDLFIPVCMHRGVLHWSGGFLRR